MSIIEDIPLDNESIDVITSNCVINLCESKEAALKEAYRVLKNGGRLAISDVVVLKDIPDEIRHSVEMWVGCIAGALPIEEYKEILPKVGFKNIEITPVNIYTKEVIEEIAKQKNLASIALHNNCGFREIGVREKISKMSNGVWHDVVLMERRSKIVGIN